MIFADLNYALRLLRKKPGFTFLTTVVMASGIGLSIYLFSFFHTMVFKALPYEDGATLVQISSSEEGSQNGDPMYQLDYNEIPGNVKGLTEFSSYRMNNFNVTGKDGARRYNGALVEANIFQLTRTPPILGREFSPADNRPGSEPVMIISYEMWQNQFNGSAQVIDQTVRIDGVSHRILGVMPEGYAFPLNAELWKPLQTTGVELSRDSGSSVTGLAHLDGSASLEQINKDIALVMQRLEERFPETNTGRSAYVSSIPLAGEGETLPIIYSAHIIAILVLILASINVGNLFLSRAVERSRETAIRVALGAPRSRLIWQMLWESILICVAGGLIGLLLLSFGLESTTTIIEQLFVDKPPYWWNFGVDGYTITLFLVFVFATILVTGLLPAWRNSGSDFNAALRDGTRGATSKKSGRLNRFLIISEIFVSLTVLISASVMMVGNYKATQADYGADTDGMINAQFLLTSTKYEGEAEKVAFTEALQSRLLNTPGINDAVVSSALPGGLAATPSIMIEGKEYTGDSQVSYPKANYVSISQGSLQRLNVTLRSGRYFDGSDKGLNKATAIVTESFQAQHFGNESALGKRVRIVNDQQGEDVSQWLTIVGVVEHTIHGAAFGESGRMASIYRPYSQAPVSQMTIGLRSGFENSRAIGILRDTVRSVDVEVPLFRVESYQDSIERHTNGIKFITNIFAMFGIAAVFLAASGIYGVVSNTIAQRTQEIGIKRALGADEARVTKEFLWTGVKQLLWGGIPGVLVGAAMGFAMASFLGVSSADLVLVTFVLVSIVAAAVLLATYLPTRNVLELEPINALRYE
ncbi:MAG: ABC transporter permease [Aestuariibacter sp.]